MALPSVEEMVAALNSPIVPPSATPEVPETAAEETTEKNLLVEILATVSRIEGAIGSGKIDSVKMEDNASSMLRCLNPNADGFLQ